MNGRSIPVKGRLRLRSKDPVPLHTGQGTVVVGLLPVVDEDVLAFDEGSSPEFPAEETEEEEGRMEGTEDNTEIFVFAGSEDNLTTLVPEPWHFQQTEVGNAGTSVKRRVEEEEEEEEEFSIRVRLFSLVEVSNFIFPV